MSNALLVIDEGTSSTRAVLVEADGRFARIAQHPIRTRYPRPGWVEQDAAEIWSQTLKAMGEAIGEDIERISAIGITNQRETIVAWDRATGEPLAPAIVWQDRRTADRCNRLREEYGDTPFQYLSGLLIDPYFSATKIEWMMSHWPEVAAAGDRLMLGTIDSWLVYKLSGGAHLTDATNASRTLLMNLRGNWESGACSMFKVPVPALPSICDSAGQLAHSDIRHFGRAIPITAIIGDQQAAAIGQGCLAPGDTKATYGTGAFILSHVGTGLFDGLPDGTVVASHQRQFPKGLPISSSRLLCTVAWQLGGQRSFALEGSLFVAGQVIKWLRDELGLVETAKESEKLARSVASSEGVALVPAFAGLGAPHWRADARGAIMGLTLGSTKAHIVRAALEAVANQSAELQRAFAADNVAWTSLRIDGGMANNDFVAQDIADALGIAVERPANVESTVLGAAMLAAVGCGLHTSLADAVREMRGVGRWFEPRTDAATRLDRLARWDRAVSGVTTAVG